MPLLTWVGPALIGAALACGASDGQPRQPDRDWERERARMVDEQLRGRDIKNPRVLDAMRAVPRHLFVPDAERREAYGDFPLPIGHEQTISQPYIVAFMTEALEVGAGDRVLEIGTGSGYQAAVLSTLAREVYTIEIVAPLAERARDTLAALGYQNVRVRTGNGYLGWPEHAPYDRIMVTAAPDAIPPALLQQLKVGGLMAMPLGTADRHEPRHLRRPADWTQTLPPAPGASARHAAHAAGTLRPDGRKVPGRATGPGPHRRPGHFARRRAGAAEQAVQNVSMRRPVVRSSHRALHGPDRHLSGARRHLRRRHAADGHRPSRCVLVAREKPGHAGRDLPGVRHDRSSDRRDADVVCGDGARRGAGAGLPSDEDGA